MSGDEASAQDAGEAFGSAAAEPTAQHPHTVSPSQYGKPAPQFGVYASPEEQRARIRQPDATFALQAGESPMPPAREARRAAASGNAARPAPNTAETAGGSVPAARLVDRLATVALLSYGLINVLFAVVGLSDVTSYFGAAYEVLGVPGSFTSTPFAQASAVIASVVLVSGYVITAVFSIRRLLRGRVSWWVPLAGAAATQFVVGVLLSAALLSDPAFSSFIASLR